MNQTGKQIEYDNRSGSSVTLQIAVAAILLRCRFLEIYWQCGMLEIPEIRIMMVGQEAFEPISWKLPVSVMPWKMTIDIIVAGTTHIEGMVTEYTMKTTGFGRTRHRPRVTKKGLIVAVCCSLMEQNVWLYVSTVLCQWHFWHLVFIFYFMKPLTLLTLAVIIEIRFSSNLGRGEILNKANL